MDDAELAAIIGTQGSSFSRCRRCRARSRRHARARLSRSKASASWLSSASFPSSPARATADGCWPKRSAWRGATASSASTSTPARSIIRLRWPPTAARASSPTSARSSDFPIRACSASCRPTARLRCRVGTERSLRLAAARQLNVDPRQHHHQHDGHRGADDLRSSRAMIRAPMVNGSSRAEHQLGEDPADRADRDKQRPAPR